MYIYFYLKDTIYLYTEREAKRALKISSKRRLTIEDTYSTEQGLLTLQQQKIST